jgi:RNA polymerase sigma factor (TIGR02999 family)
VNEAYLRLVDGSQAAPSDRAHFLALAARAMRYIIIDYARQRGAAKRGGAAQHIQLDENEIAINDQVQQLLSLDDAIQALARLDERLVRMVECRFFSGMTEEETAEALEISLSTVQRDWKRAKAWLKEEMRGFRDRMSRDARRTKLKSSQPFGSGSGAGIRLRSLRRRIPEAPRLRRRS